MKTQFKPILFSTPMVQAILEGRKTQTRRVIKPTSKKGCYGIQIERNMQGKVTNVVGYDEHERTWDDNGSPYRVNNKYQVDDILWVRETLYQNGELELLYDADNQTINEDIIPKDFNVRVDKNGNYKFCKIPSIYMEKWASRIFLKVTNVRVERLQDISEDDAISEGISRGRIDGYWKDYFYDKLKEDCVLPTTSFSTLWQSINGEQSWNDNPWVWVIEFERVEKPETF